ncbi:Sodium/hydrogen exchanger family [Rhizoctonia solani]|uniref:Sodium/hydrogen exchanger family n=1 Tax=Rhizoctonia solani TaxID=456999 RepID=A0A8H7I564_9AGAM|nr:Sodium/hydrogen exchanger family [Rhizoctonia solani]
MEVDLAVFRRNAKKSIVISAAGMLLPFAVGVGVAVPVYHKFVNPGDASFGLFLLFIRCGHFDHRVPCAVPYSDGIEPVGNRSLSLYKTVKPNLAAWILLALTVTLINASDGLTALWILLTCVGWILFIVFPIKWGYLWLARRSGSLGNGTPTPSMMTVTMLLVFVSSFFTDVIGVHAIFGAFIAGLIVPRDNGFSISLLEKIEDLVSILFLPLYFTLSGLKTDLGLLNDGTAWGIPSCLVELIVLNIGLSAGILDTKVFSMFVMMAVILTLLLRLAPFFGCRIYPEHAREHVSPNKSSSETPVNRTRRRSTSNTTGPISLMTRFTVVLSKVEHLPAVMTLTQFLQPPQTISSTMSKAHLIGYSDEKVDVLDPNSQAISPLAGNLPVLSDGTPRVSIDALRLIELTERTSAVMKGTGSEELMHRDTVISVMRTFGHLNRIPVSSVLSIVPRDSFSSSVTSHARETNADLVNPFDAIFGGRSAGADKTTTMNYSQFIRRVFAESPSDVALFIDRGLSPLETNTTYGQHIFLPFSGGPDDRLALAFVVQLCTHPAVSATVMRMRKTDGLEEVETRFTDLKSQQSTTELDNNITFHSLEPDTVYPQNTTQHRLQSEAADNLLWTQMTSSSAVQSPVVQNARSRVTFVEDESPVPLAGILQRCKFEHTTATSNNKALLVVVGRGRRMAELYTDELRRLVASSNASGRLAARFDAL